MGYVLYTLTVPTFYCKYEIGLKYEYQFRAKIIDENVFLTLWNIGKSVMRYVGHFLWHLGQTSMSKVVMVSCWQED